MIRADFPTLHIKGFTAVEIHYFAEKYNKSYETVLLELMQAGLAPRVRRKICRDKVDGDGWIEIHRTAHRLGLKLNCTMLYGTIEAGVERIEHLIKLRR